MEADGGSGCGRRGGCCCGGPSGTTGAAAADADDGGGTKGEKPLLTGQWENEPPLPLMDGPKGGGDGETGGGERDGNGDCRGGWGGRPSMTRGEDRGGR